MLKPLDATLDAKVQLSDFSVFSSCKLNSLSEGETDFASLSRESSANAHTPDVQIRLKADTNYLIDQQRFEV